MNDWDEGRRPSQAPEDTGDLSVLTWTEYTSDGDGGC